MYETTQNLKPNDIFFWFPLHCIPKGAALLKIVACSFTLLIIQTNVSLSAQRLFHSSVSVNCDVFSSRCMGLDFTALYNSSWGIRYTKVNDLNYLSTHEYNTELHSLSYSGDFIMPMIIKTLGFKVFNAKSKTMFDFLTAYIGLGSADLSLKLERERYYVNGSNLVMDSRTDNVKAPTRSVAFGIYGGERFLVVDWRLLYATGRTEANDLVDSKYSFSMWMMLFSVGFGF